MPFHASYAHSCHLLSLCVDRSYARLPPYLLLTPLSAVERAIYPGDRRAHPRLEPECAISARPEGVHLDNGDRHRNARRRRIRYERKSSSDSSPVILPRLLTLTSRVIQLKSHFEEHEYAFYVMTAVAFAAFIGAAWSGVRRYGPLASVDCAEVTPKLT